MFTKRKRKSALAFLLLTLTMFSSYAHTQEVKPTEEDKKSQLQQRIDFGNAYIMGQSIKSGAVYLLHRKKSDIDSMLKVRTDYRKEISDDFALEDTKIIPEETDE